ncbi:MAG: hypothetical protein EHM80_03460 [Nitrospiraceae bacterium]|nr:MAG: hypothetical protein EHM80_15800 [Nitrospiraceae bacterium]RPH81088.1 MAG: hypothetical protein EHM80_03460 [Nitrospiraceae bacterium]
MDEIKRYDSPTGIMDGPRQDGEWVTCADCEAAVAAAARAERKRCRREEVRPLLATVHWILTSHAWSVVDQTLVDVEKIQKELP